MMGSLLSVCPYLPFGMHSLVHFFFTRTRAMRARQLAKAKRGSGRHCWRPSRGLPLSSLLRLIMQMSCNPRVKALVTAPPQRQRARRGALAPQVSSAVWKSERGGFSKTQAGWHVVAAVY